MRVAVKTGLIFFPSCFFLAAVGLGRTFYLTLFKRRAQEVPRFALALCGLGWFLNIVVFLPFTPTYVGGYWLPRLILPAILTFIVLSATELDRPSSWACGTMVLGRLRAGDAAVSDTALVFVAAWSRSAYLDPRLRSSRFKFA